MSTNLKVRVAARQEHNDKIGVIDIDLSYKLFLVAQALKNQRRIGVFNYAKISQSILVKSGIFLQPDECRKIIKKYPFLVKKSYTFSAILTAATLFSAI